METLQSAFETIARSENAGQSSDDAMSWFTRQPRDWFLVIDNADDPQLKLAPWIPQCNHGNVLITTRNPKCRIYAPKFSCEVHRMSVEDAIRLLIVSADAEMSPESEGQARSIVEELGCLALAIVQAGRFIAETCCLDEYLQMYKNSRADLLLQYSVQNEEDYEWAVYTAWEMSRAKLGIPAATFLQICAFLHFDGISKELFQRAALEIRNSASEPQASHNKFISELPFLAGEWRDLEFYKIISQLESFSLITVDKINKIYSFHPLIHAWARDRVSPEDQEATLQFTIQLLAWCMANIPNTGAGYIFRRTLLSHTNALHPLTDGNVDGIVCFWLNYYNTGRWKEAEYYSLQLVEIRTRTNGENHPSTLTCMSNLAMVYSKQMKAKEAEELGLKVLEARKRTLGHQHPDTLYSMNNLAATYTEQGRLREAEELQVQVVEAFKNTLGEDRDATLNSMIWLARTYFKQGRLSEALEHWLRVTEGLKKRLGEDQPKTLAGMNNLALTYGKLGRYDEAEKILAFVVNVSGLVYGQKNRSTLVAMENLAKIYGIQGRSEDEKNLWRQVEEAKSE